MLVDIFIAIRTSELIYVQNFCLANIKCNEVFSKVNAPTVSAFPIDLYEELTLGNSKIGVRIRYSAVYTVQIMGSHPLSGLAQVFGSIPTPFSHPQSIFFYLTALIKKKGFS
jgi:hypothetical protein